MKITISFILLTISIYSYAAELEKNPFSHRSEVAIVTTGGNTRLETYNAKTNNKYKIGKRTYGASGHYTLGLSEPEEGEGNGNDLIESARSWDAKVNYVQEIAPHIGLFASVQYEGNTFVGYKQRENYDIGYKYTFVDTRERLFWFELGYRYTEEQRTEENDDGESFFHFNKGIVETELRRKNKSFNYGFWLQYLPNFTKAKDYQINFEPSFAVIINKTFSLKVGYQVNFDNEPNVKGNERIDWKYTTSLVAEF